MDSFGFQWHITDRCNLRCAHCYQEDFSPADERSLDDLCRMADEVLGTVTDCPVSINVTGGEPFLVPHLVPFLSYLHRFPNLAEIHVITNGTLAPPPLLEALASQPLLRSLKVSVEAGDAGANDRIRGAGAFERVRRNLPLLRERTGKDTVLMVTLGRHNAGCLEGILKLGAEVGAAGVILERFVPLGAGSAMADQVLDASGWAGVMHDVARLAELDMEEDELLPYRAFWIELESGLPSDVGAALCNLGRESMALMPDGTVYPCRRFPESVGNVLTEPFSRVLARLEEYAVEAVRPRLLGPRCSACTWAECAGCRALVRALGGHPFGDDPQCPSGQ